MPIGMRPDAMHARHNAAGLPRVVVTGMGAVSCLGMGTDALLDAMREGRSGIRHMEAFADLGMRSRVGGPVDPQGLLDLPRKLRRFLATPALYAWYALHEALEQSGLLPERLSHADCGLVMGGGAALSEHQFALENFRERGIERISPFTVPRGMSSNLSASLAHIFGIGGYSYTMSSACTSATHAIGHAMELIQLGKQNVVLCGGSDELHDTTALWFDAMDALSSTSNAHPERASRPYDSARDGFVLAAGAGVLVLESLDHAQQRGAPILAEITAYGTGTDATSMVGPGAEGIARAIRQALDRADELPDYINTHACSTRQGDLAEWQAIASVFGEHGAPVPPMSSIKGLSGHAPGAAGALDAIACLLMLEHEFLAGQAIGHLDADFAQAPLVTASRRQRIDSVLSNSFGFGGSCASLMFRRHAGCNA
ncbi:beta-ketoacyl synthase N-terminal-like domain-containing protein [Dyella sp. GSA-30]|uniref:beta-ketoacyl-[acyl-carrier-protein] synthase family protein n=1 Tax=Dyella sp. GSA-30 TaxID=2994496 RepID=UPI002492DCD5|nr:beta-ketoacyl synthase N-terminal-like domain-containing protein [Dyella sp. GSA-30]BDU22475.1 beta-ketoacyl-[acyl-carrier-protein] synthase I [Dyella sp. GSA-30]